MLGRFSVWKGFFITATTMLDVFSA